ncbi:hypothetical protein SUNI508_05483 [Seiridium unicorne]|uniref:Uncharacterized protein n=1 Tax=Seiridium unicorne TaxID=138068 RepID=A0ABR2V3Q6_9PEZI
MIGLDCLFLHQPCEDYDNSVAVLRLPNFRPIDLALLADKGNDLAWAVDRNKYLKRLFSKAKDLQHVSLRYPRDYDLFSSPFPDDLPVSTDNYVSLRTIFPVERWHKLRHFGLLSLSVRQGDLISLLLDLSDSLRSVELGHLRFANQSGCWRELLSDMRSGLDWHSRIPSERPTVSLLCDEFYTSVRLSHRFTVLCDVVNDSLYGEAINPFHERDGNQPKNGSGIVQDSLLPSYSHSNINISE